MLQKIKKFWLLLEGRKTYLVGSAATLLQIFVVLYPNALTLPELAKIDGILVALGGMALRSAVTRN